MSEYITQRANGTYQFQFQPPLIIREQFPTLQRNYRVKLSKNRKSAITQARFWKIMMDKAMQQIVLSPEDFERVLELMKEYQRVEELGWEHVESFLGSLNEEDEKLFEAANSSKHEIVEYNPYLHGKQDAQPTTHQNGDLKPILNGILQLLSRPQAQAQETTNNKSEVQKDRGKDLLLQESFNRFWKHKNEQTIGVPALNQIRQKLNRFGEIITQGRKIDLSKTYLSHLTTEDIRYFRDTVKVLPTHCKRGKVNIQEIIASDRPKITQTQVRRYYGAITEYLIWLEVEAYDINPTFSKILKNSKSKTKLNKPAVPRLPLSRDDMRLVFGDDVYTQGKLREASDFWCPLIGLFTGMREGEILQLAVGDIRIVEDVWVFDVNDSNDTDTNKSVKTDAGHRLIPIHNQLINMGLLDYHKLRAATHTKLFNDTKFVGGGWSFSQRFNKGKLLKYGIKSLTNEYMKDFHSFRHNVRTQLTENNVDEAVINETVGHAGVGVGRKVYTHGNFIAQKLKAINTLKYNIDFDAILGWEQHKFGIDMLRTK